METCKGCEYRRPLNPSKPDGIKVCHYCIDTGLPRAMTAKECYSKRPHSHFMPKRGFAPVPFGKTRAQRQNRKGL